VRGSRRSGGRRPETVADTKESQLLMTEMRQELGELRRLRDQIMETASLAAVPEALPAPTRVAPRAGPSASTRSTVPAPGTPLEVGLQLIKADKSDHVLPYREAPGSLMYLMVGTRPDLAFAIGKLSRFVS